MATGRRCRRAHQPRSGLPDCVHRGADADLLDLQSGIVTQDVFFSGGDDADLLVVRSTVGRIRFDGDAGDDSFLITGTVTGPDSILDGVVEFNAGGDADLLVSRGTLRRLVFTGGADDNISDVLQITAGVIDELEFFSETGEAAGFSSIAPATSARCPSPAMTPTTCSSTAVRTSAASPSPERW